MAGTIQVLISTPTMALVPPRPASEPTDLPENRSLGNVWMLLIDTWKPNSTTAIRRTAKTGSAA
ncbi:hypothetical protein D3C83_158260 [compost metagenome]